MKKRNVDFWKTIDARLKNKYKFWEPFLRILIVLLISFTLGALSYGVCKAPLNKDSMFWIFSTLIQAFAALLAVIGMFLVYRLQTIRSDIERTRCVAMGDLGYISGEQYPPNNIPTGDFVHILTEAFVEYARYFIQKATDAIPRDSPQDIKSSMIRTINKAQVSVSKLEELIAEENKVKHIFVPVTCVICLVITSSLIFLLISSMYVPSSDTIVIWGYCMVFGAIGLSVLATHDFVKAMWKLLLE